MCHLNPGRTVSSESAITTQKSMWVGASQLRLYLLGAPKYWHRECSMLLYIYPSSQITGDACSECNDLIVCTSNSILDITECLILISAIYSTTKLIRSGLCEVNENTDP